MGEKQGPQNMSAIKIPGIYISLIFCSILQLHLNSAAQNQTLCLYKPAHSVAFDSIGCDFNTGACFTEFDETNKLSIYGCANFPKNHIKCSNTKADCYYNKHKTICCCTFDRCNNADQMYTALFESMPDKKIVNDMSKWWNVALLMVATCASLFLVTILVASTWVLHHLHSQTIDMEKHDEDLLQKINFKKQDVVQTNRDTAHKNADVAVKELYYFLEQRQLIRSPETRRTKNYHKPIVISIKNRSAKELESRIDTSSPLTSRRVT